MRLFKAFVVSAFLLALPVTALAIPVAGGFTSGPDSSFSINFTFLNDASSTEDITSIVLDGSTGTAFPILWDSLGTAVGPAGATVAFAGEDTQVGTITFGDAPDGFNPGESFALNGVDPDGDPGPVSVTIGQLAGVQVTFNFRDGSSLLTEFVDDPADRAGLVLAPVGSAPIPEPGAALVFGAGALLMAGQLKRRSRRSS